MKRVITTEKQPIYLWLDDIEDGALQQAKDLANLPFTHKHIAIMPDSHQGYGMPIGGVMATIGVVVPNAVGVDIGCGMTAVKTSLKHISLEHLKTIIGKIRDAIPVGFNHQAKPMEWNGFDRYPPLQIVSEPKEKAQYQLGTLGGGNHFIEIQHGSDGYIWIMIHSGSRHLGLSIAKDYHEQAQTECKAWYSDIPNKDLAFLPLDSNHGQNYMAAMNFALDFAAENRSRMQGEIKGIFSDVFNDIVFRAMVSIHHNYASMENHFGKNVMVHRKGATSARAGEYGIIPGSQGTKSYIIKGKGNADSFCSCSHGAGRKMGRKQAERDLDLSTQQEMLDNQGILHSIHGTKDLDEAPGAYKDISVVMDNQSDLVDIVVELTPLAVVKG